MAIPVSSSLTQLNSNIFFREGFELSLDAIVPSIALTGAFDRFQSKTQFYIYDYAKTLLYENLDHSAVGSYLPPPIGTSTSPTAGFTYSSSGLGLACIDASSVTGSATYAWDFGDGIGTSTSQSPNYTYATSGTYNVCLTILDSCGSDTVCQSVTIVAPCTAPTAEFTYSSSGLGLTCVDASSVTGTATYVWDFGDGSGTSTSR